MADGAQAELSPELGAWVEQCTGARPIRTERLSGGGSRHTILVDARRPDGAVLPLVLRLEGGGSHSGTSFSLEREYHVYRALEGTATPTPKAYGLTPDGSALLLERLEGTADFRAMDPEVQRVVAERFMEALGHLHALDARNLNLPGFATPRSAVEHATVDLGRWEELARESCWDEPLIRYFTLNYPEGDKWRFTHQWPLPAQQMRRLYLQDGRSGTSASVNDGSLGVKPPPGP